MKQAPHRRGTHQPPLLDSAAASFALLLHVHRSGDIGSPRVSGSTSCSNASFTPGWVFSIPGRPAPARRTRPVTWTPHSISRRPLRTVSRAKPVAAETRASPPYPMARDSAAAHKRRPRSSSNGPTTEYLATTAASVPSSRLTQTEGPPFPQPGNLILARGLTSGSTFGSSKTWCRLGFGSSPTRGEPHFSHCSGTRMTRRFTFAAGHAGRSCFG